VLSIGNRSDRRREDAIERGEQFKFTDDLGYFCRSFLLYNGALIHKD